MASSIPQLALFILAVGTGIGNQLFACATKGGESPNPMGNSETPGHSFSQFNSATSVTIRGHNHSHGSQSRVESTIRALEQKMRAEGMCGDDKFDEYNPNPTHQAMQTSPLSSNSMLQTMFHDGTTQLPHIAATGNYDPEHEIVHVGVNVQEPLRGCVGPQCVTMCWCSNGAYLRVRGFAYKVTSIMYKDESLCLYDKCSMSNQLDDMVSKASQQPKDERTFTVQVADIPNAPFRLTVESVTHRADGLLKAHVSFSEGNMGMMMPGWICIRCCDGVPLQLFVARINIGCIHRIEKSGENVGVQRYHGSVSPEYRKVELGGRVYYLPNTIPDQTPCLARDVQQLLMGGDAVVDTCPRY